MSVYHTEQEYNAAAVADAEIAPVNLLRPLAKCLKSTFKQMQENDVPKDRRSVSLRKEDWPKQFEADINLCLGITIRWV